MFRWLKERRAARAAERRREVNLAIVAQISMEFGGMVLAKCDEYGEITGAHVYPDNEDPDGHPTVYGAECSCGGHDYWRHYYGRNVLVMRHERKDKGSTGFPS